MSTVGQSSLISKVIVMVMMIKIFIVIKINPVRKQTFDKNASQWLSPPTSWSMVTTVSMIMIMINLTMNLVVGKKLFLSQTKSWSSISSSWPSIIMIIHIIMTMVVGKEQGKHGGDGHGGREGGENHRWHRDYNDHHHFHSCSRWDAQGQTSCLAAESTRSSPGPNSTFTTIYMAQKKSTQCLVILTRSWLFWFCTSCILIIFHTTIYVCQDLLRKR